MGLVAFASCLAAAAAHGLGELGRLIRLRLQPRPAGVRTDLFRPSAMQGAVMPCWIL